MRAPVRYLLSLAAMLATACACAQAPVPAPAPGAAAAAAAAPPAAPAEPRFAIYEFEIEGNSVLPVTAVEAAVLPHLGPGRSMADVERAREALEKAYQQGGWLTVLVDIPEQRVEGGVVRLRVLEGRVDRVRVTGAKYFDQGEIRRRTDAIAPGTVPDFNRLQAQLGTLQRDERQVQPVLRPGHAPGTVEVELKVADRLPLSGSVELNNRHAADTEPWRLQASLRYDNLWQREHGLALTLITAPQATEQSKAAVLNYSVPLGGERTLLATALWSDSAVQPLGAFTVYGQGTTLGLRLVQQVFSAGSSHTLSLGADYKDLKERQVFGSSSDATPLRYLPLQLAYTGVWPRGRALSSLNLTATVALRGLLQRDVPCQGGTVVLDQFACKRGGSEAGFDRSADGSFATLRADLRHQQPLPGGLPGLLALRLAGQAASQAVVSAEQFSLGGADTVRGYFEAEASGDDAVLASLEWRSPALWRRAAPAVLSAGAGANAAATTAAPAAWGLDELSLLGFVDAGRTRVRLADAGQAVRIPLLSAGLGLRVRAATRLSAELDVAWPLRETSRTRLGDPRWHARLAATF